MAQETGRRLVVGVDGSDDSKLALRWAAEHALLLGGTVEAVTAWEVPLTIIVSPTATEADYAHRAGGVLQAAVDEVASEHPEVTITPYLLEGRPARVLSHQAQGAHLLILGSHGRGELPGMHLGSVANYLVHHAPCPVVVLRRAAP